MDQHKIERLFQDGCAEKINDYLWRVTQNNQVEYQVENNIKPMRDFPIGKEEIIDLKITLAACNTIDEIIKAINTL